MLFKRLLPLWKLWLQVWSWIVFTVEKSHFCRLDSDCWDVKLKFFDPENSRRAKKLFRFTIDVSDIIPVTLGEVRSWSTPY